MLLNGVEPGGESFRQVQVSKGSCRGHWAAQTGSQLLQLSACCVLPCLHLCLCAPPPHRFSGCWAWQGRGAHLERPWRWQYLQDVQLLASQLSATPSPNDLPAADRGVWRRSQRWPLAGRPQLAAAGAEPGTRQGETCIHAREEKCSVSSLFALVCATRASHVLMLRKLPALAGQLGSPAVWSSPAHGT